MDIYKKSFFVCPTKEGVYMNKVYLVEKLNKKSFLSFILYPFSLFFAFIVCCRRLVYTIIPSFSYKSKAKIISIGNITSGGSGKTPYVLYLAKQLSKKHKIAIVLRGYKGNLERENVIVTTEFIKDAGDEATLYVQKLPNIPVCVGKNRVKSIKLLEKKIPDLEIILLDDAFQNLNVHQDTRICVFNANNPISNGLCLPAGLLREPLKNLKYADTFVIIGENYNFQKKLEKFNKPITVGYYIISKIVIATPFVDNNKENNQHFENVEEKKISINTLMNKKIILLSGIGNPKSFEHTINKAGLTFLKHIKLPDHFCYTQKFLDSLNNIPKKKYDFIITTEKDYTKIKKLKTTFPLLVVHIEFQL